MDPDRDWLGPIIEEHETVAVEESTLYSLDKVRGLTVLDAGQPDQIAILSRLALGGVPVALHQRGKTVLATLNERMTYAPCADCATGVKPFHGAAVVAIDVTDPRRPRVLSESALDGQVVGLRNAGDAIHLITALLDRDPHHVGADRAASGVRAVVINTAAPDRLRIEHTRELFGASWVPTVQMADGRAYVTTSVDSPSGACRVVGLDGNTRSASACIRLVVVDFTAATGPVAAASVDLHGSVQWRGGLLRVTNFIRDPSGARLEVMTFESRSAAELRLLGAGAVMLPDASNYEVYLEGAKVVLVPWQRGLLRTVDVSDPAKPALRGSIEVDDRVAAPIVRGDRVVLLRRAATEPAATARPYGLELVAMDTADLGKPTVVSRAPVAAGELLDGRDWTRAALALLEPLGLILVPFDVERAASLPRSSRTGMHAFTLADNGALTDAGVLDVVFGRERLAVHGTRVFAVSAARVQTLGLEGGRLRAGAATTSTLDVHTFAATADGILASTFDARTATASLHPVTGPTLDDVGPAIPLEQNPARFLVAAGHAYLASPDGRLQVVELGQTPRRRGTLPPLGRANYWEAELVGPQTLVVPLSREHDCWRTPNEPRCAGWNEDLAVVSLANPDAPRVLWRGPIADPEAPFDTAGLSVKGTTVMVGVRSGIEVPRPDAGAGGAAGGGGAGGGAGFGGGQPPPDLPRRWRYWLVNVDLVNPGQPKVGAAIEVPGTYLGDVNGVSYALEDVATAAYRLHSYRLTGNSAEALATVPLDLRAFSVALGPQAAYFAAQGKLGVIDLSDPRRLQIAPRLDLLGSSYHRPGSGLPDQHELVGARAVVGQSLLISVEGRMLAFDVRNPLRPVYRTAIPFRWASEYPLRLTPDGRRVLVASGRYPVGVVDGNAP